MEIVEQGSLNPWRLGQVMRRRRCEMGITQAECAEMALVSVAWLSAFENGKPSCEVGLVMEVAEALGLTFAVMSNTNEYVHGEIK